MLPYKLVYIGHTWFSYHSYNMRLQETFRSPELWKLALGTQLPKVVTAVHSFLTTKVIWRFSFLYDKVAWPALLPVRLPDCGIFLCVDQHSRLPGKCPGAFTAICSSHNWVFVAQLAFHMPWEVNDYVLVAAFSFFFFISFTFHTSLFS